MENESWFSRCEIFQKHLLGNVLTFVVTRLISLKIDKNCEEKEGDRKIELLQCESTNRASERVV